MVFCGSLPLFRERFPKLTLAEASPALARQVSEEVGMTVAKSTEASAAEQVLCFLFFVLERVHGGH